MATATRTVADIKRLVWLFLPHCNDRDTLLALDAMAAEPKQWSEGHQLFQRIRFKTLASERTGDRLSNIQYHFEEVCAKALYNFSGFPAPFDKDSPDWIRPNALALAQALSIPDPDSVVGLGA
jgi:hypothetical protein